MEVEAEVKVEVEHLVQEAAEGALEGAGQPAGLAELDHHLRHGGAALHLLHHPPPTLHHLAWEEAMVARAVSTVLETPGGR